MKLNYKRTILVGFAFFLICTFWQAYDTIIPKILTDKFGMTQTLSGIIMALDNILALFLLPFFGGLSDKCKSKLGRRKPYVLIGTLIAVVAFFALSMVDYAQLNKNIRNVTEINTLTPEEVYDLVADKPLVMEDGTIAYSGSAQEVLSNAEIMKHGAVIPEVAKFGHAMAAAGKPLSDIPVTMEEAVRLVKERGIG